MDDITCPYCKHSRFADADDYDDDGTERTQTCHKCSKEFITTISISHLWESKCTEHKWKDDFDEPDIWQECEYCGDLEKKAVKLPDNLITNP